MPRLGVRFRPKGYFIKDEEKRKLFVTLTVNKRGKTVIVYRKSKKPLWECIKKYINKIEVGKTFTRKEMIDYLYTNKPYDKQLTMDSYRLSLESCGFIEKTDNVGVYLKKYDIPMELKTSTIRKAMRDPSWKQWFSPMHERLGLTEVQLPI